MNAKVILPNPKRFKSWWAQCLTEAHESGTKLDIYSYRKTHFKHEWVNRRQCLNIDYFNVPDVLRTRMSLRLDPDVHAGVSNLLMLDPSGEDVLARVDPIDITSLYMGCSNVFEFIAHLLKPIIEQVDMRMTGATTAHREALRFSPHDTSTYIIDVLHELEICENYKGSKFKDFLNEFIEEAFKNNFRNRLGEFGDFSYFHSLENTEKSCWINDVYRFLREGSWLYFE